MGLHAFNITPGDGRVIFVADPDIDELVETHGVPVADGSPVLVARRHFLPASCTARSRYEKLNSLPTGWSSLYFR